MRGVQWAKLVSPCLSCVCSSGSERASACVALLFI